MLQFCSKYSVSKLSLLFKNLCIIYHLFNKKCDKVAIVQKSMYYFGISSLLDIKSPHRTFWIIVDTFLHIVDCISRSVGLPLLDLSIRLAVINNLLLQALIMQCFGGSMSCFTRSLSLTSFMAWLVWSLAMKNKAA